MKTRRFWVFIEQEEGTPHPVSWELLGVVRRLREEVKDELEKTGDEVLVEGVVLGDGLKGIPETALEYGADTVYVMDDPIFKHYRNQPYYKALIALANKYKPEVFLIGATTLGRDLAGAVATSLRTGLTADCTGLEMGEVTKSDHKLLLSTRPAFGGNVLATIVCRDHMPQMSSVRPRVFPTPEKIISPKGKIVNEPVCIDEKEVTMQIMEFIRSDTADTVDIEYADVIVAGGRGVGSPEGFQLLKELADALDGTVGTTRPCVDAGWMKYPFQIGQTGKTVRPKLYIAAGISGALQHKVGVQNSDFIIAINTNPAAPIFEIADIGIVGDLYEVIPEMIKQVKARKEALS